MRGHQISWRKRYNARIAEDSITFCKEFNAISRIQIKIRFLLSNDTKSV